ncbi:hypothetical protein CPB85DRAFT_199393 [Mucidula mucida]|nr:hypothetical protein CPB85DRAFT_199393 [Mucidula mucida]
MESSIAPRLVPPIDLTEVEKKVYYYGLCSSPILVARSGTIPWEAPSGPEAYHRPKELRIAGDHKIAEVWEDDLALKVEGILNEKQVQWTSMDVVRIGYADESSAPVVLWLGVKPRSLSPEDGVVVVAQCKELLAAYVILDVDVEIRESDVFTLAGSSLLAPGFDEDPTAEVREPLTATVGTPICAKPSPWAEGTGGFFIRASSASPTIYLVTARHVVLPYDMDDNNIYQRKSPSTPAREIVLFSDISFQEFLKSIQKKIASQQFYVEYHAERLVATGDGDVTRRQAVQKLMLAAEAKVEALSDFLREVSAQWGTEIDRIIGHVVYAPPIVLSAGPRGYTQDVAIIEINPQKIDPSTFECNVIDLGFEYPPEVLTDLMYPNPKNIHNFKYPLDRILSLRGVIPDSELQKPKMCDQDGIIVLKRGRGSGLTVGHANNVVSYTRYYLEGQEGQRSKEWAILPYNMSLGAFSAPGDSGAAIVDGAGRVGGLLTSGSGVTDSIDISYATPMTFVMDTIRACESFSQAVFSDGAKD